MDSPKSLDRIIELRRQGGAHHGGGVSPRGPGCIALVVDMHRDRYLRDQRLAGQLAAIGEITT